MTTRSARLNPLISAPPSCPRACSDTTPSKVDTKLLNTSRRECGGIRKLPYRWARVGVRLGAPSLASSSVWSRAGLFILRARGRAPIGPRRTGACSGLVRRQIVFGMPAGTHPPSRTRVNSQPTPLIHEGPRAVIWLRLIGVRSRRTPGTGQSASELPAEMARREMNPAGKLLDSERLLQMTLHPGDEVGETVLPPDLMLQRL